MPTIARIGPYRFLFYTNEGNEPAHIPVFRDQAEAKFWLPSAELAFSKRFPAHELRRIERLVVEHAAEFLEAWNERHSGRA